MVGWDGIEPPTPGFSVRPLVLISLGNPAISPIHLNLVLGARWLGLARRRWARTRSGHVHRAAAVTVASFAAACCRSAVDTMAYRLYTLSVRCPVIFIATERDTPACSRFRTAERRRSWNRTPGRPDGRPGPRPSECRLRGGRRGGQRGAGGAPGSPAPAAARWPPPGPPAPAR